MAPLFSMRESDWYSFYVFSRLKFDYLAPCHSQSIILISSFLIAFIITKHPIVCVFLYLLYGGPH